MSDISKPTSSEPMDKQSGIKTPPTFGEQLVGITFNPSNDDAVSKAKRLCADLADLLHEENKKSETSPLKAVLYQHTIGEILNAQMNVVKVLTLKY
jgi:hypothetical protein